MVKAAVGKASLFSVVIGLALMTSACNSKESAERDRQYDDEIRLQTKFAEIRESGSKELEALGGLTEAISASDAASASYETVGCLKEQKKQGIPFYTGKATCKSAVN